MPDDFYGPLNFLQKNEPEYKTTQSRRDSRHTVNAEKFNERKLLNQLINSHAAKFHAELFYQVMNGDDPH